MNRGTGGGGMRGGGHGGPMHGAVAFEKPKNAKKTFGRIIAYIGTSKYLVILLLTIMLFVTLLNLAGPTLQAEAIDSISIDGQNRLNVDFHALFVNLAILGVSYILSSIFTLFQGRLAADLSQKTVYRMRNDLFAKMERLPIRYTDTHPHGDIMSRMTNDIENVSNAVSSSIASLFSSVITIIGALVIMLMKNPLLTLVAIVTVPLSLFATLKLSKHMRKYFIRQQALLGDINGHAEEMITGYHTVMAFTREEKSVEDFRKISSKLTKAGIISAVLGGVMGPLMNVIGNLGYLLIASTGGYLAITGAITIGTIQAFLLYSKQFTRPINELANQYTTILTAIAGAERVFEIMDEAPESDEGNIELKPENIAGNLAFDRIFFSYVEGEPVLKDFNLTVGAGQKVAIVGSTGAGKTTVANLLTRFYDVDSGTISIDGTDIRDITKASLRKNIAIVLQDTVLFADSIAANIRYGNQNATKDEMERAAAMANADTFIERLPEGYDSELTESGGNLSQGQRQLLSIARAILADPKILILDEATSNVDTRTEMHIQNAMIELMKNRTSLIIAHRLSTIKDADKIIVVDGGRVAESGSHDELLAAKGCYFRLYQNQYAGYQT